MIRITRRGALLAAPFVLGSVAGSAQAQAWPARQVRIVVGFAAGGANDIMARLLAMTPLIAQLFSKIAGTPAQTHQLLLATGSRIEPAGEAQYLRLLRMPMSTLALGITRPYSKPAINGMNSNRA